MKEHSHYVAMPIGEVMQNPEKYIIKENLEAIFYAWDMNIVTEQTNDYENEDSWIAIGMLSKENEMIYKDLVQLSNKLDPANSFILKNYGRGFRIPVTPGTENTFEKFRELFDYFKPQDVQRDGYMTIDEFYVKYTDCWKKVPNPHLDDAPHPNSFKGDIQAYIGAINDYQRKKYPTTNMIRVYDSTKATKPLEKYLEEKGLLDCYDKEEGKIFYHKRLYEGHMKYKNQSRKEETQLL